MCDFLKLPPCSVPENGITADSINRFFVYIQDLKIGVALAVLFGTCSFPGSGGSKSWIRQTDDGCGARTSRFYCNRNISLRWTLAPVRGLYSCVIPKSRSYMYVSIYIYIYMQINSCTYICHSMYAHRTWSCTENHKLSVCIYIYSNKFVYIYMA